MLYEGTSRRRKTARQWQGKEGKPKGERKKNIDGKVGHKNTAKKEKNVEDRVWGKNKRLRFRPKKNMYSGRGEGEGKKPLEKETKKRDVGGVQLSHGVSTGWAGFELGG